MISIQSAVMIIVYLVVGGIIFWLLNLLVDKSPIGEPYKGVVKWVLLALAILVLIGILLSFVSGTPIFRSSYIPAQPDRQLAGGFGAVGGFSLLQLVPCL